MELCETCKKDNCSKNIVTKQESNILIIKCLDYQKDNNKIKGYKKPIDRITKYNKSVMGLYNPSWS